MRQRLFAVMAAVLTVFICGVAWADAGYWRVSGQVINTRTNALGTQTCPKAGLNLRVKSRWANGQGCIVGLSGECPWGPSWGTSVTDSNGRFSEKSHHFADISKQRDILIQYREAVGGQWRTLKVISNISGATPHSKSGNVSNYALGVINTSLFECPTDLQPSGTGDGPGTPHTVPAAQTTPGQKKPQAKAICGRMIPGGGIARPELSLVSATVMHRIGQPQAPPERISWQVVIRSNGPAAYRATDGCRTVVRAVFAIKDMSVDRTYELPIPSLAVGASVTLTGNGNLGELSESSAANYPVTFVIDPDNELPEADETNNSLIGCYNLGSQTYAGGACP